MNYFNIIKSFLNQVFAVTSERSSRVIYDDLD